MAKPVTPQDMFDLWQKMVNPGAYPLQSLMFPVTDPAEIDKKIAELETVEHWLKANLNMLQLSIKSLEYQRQMARGGERMKRAMGGKEEAPHAAASSDEAVNPAMWAWNLMQQTQRDLVDAAQKAASGKPGAKAAGAKRRKS